MKHDRRKKVLTPRLADLFLMSKLDHLITMSGALAPVSAAVLQSYPPDALRLWAHDNAVYVFPTIELVDWLRKEIGSSPTIEIAAGNGGIAKALGVPATDSYVQASDPHIRAQLAAARQPVVVPGSHVERLEALDAIAKYRPHTVFGAYVTQLYKGPKDIDAFVHGVDEETLLERVQRYIVIGNDTMHGRKRIMNRRHRRIRAPWLVTRSLTPEQNAIYIWE